MSVRYVTPSGDMTGQTDAENLQTALDDAKASVVYVSGDLRIGRGVNVTGKRLAGIGTPTIYYVGPQKSGYVITLRGKGLRGDLSDLVVSCKSNARGILAVGVNYHRCLAGVSVSGSREVGIDLVDCWASSMDSVLVNYGRGISLRMHRCNSFLATTVVLDNAKCVDWPSVSDATVLDTAGTVVVTSENDRAVLVIGSRQDLTTFDNLILEKHECGSTPSISIKSSTTQFRNVRWEGGRHSGPLVIVRGSGSNQGDHIELNNVHVTAIEYPTEFLRLYDDTEEITIRNLFSSQYITRNIVVCDGGTHHNVRIEQLGVYHAGILDSQIIGLEHGAVLHNAQLTQ